MGLLRQTGTPGVRHSGLSHCVRRTEAAREFLVPSEVGRQGVLDELATTDVRVECGADVHVEVTVAERKS